MYIQRQTVLIAAICYSVTCLASGVGRAATIQGEVFIAAGQSNSANHGSLPQRPDDDRVSAQT